MHKCIPRYTVCNHTCMQNTVHIYSSMHTFSLSHTHSRKSVKSAMEMQTAQTQTQYPRKECSPKIPQFTRGRLSLWQPFYGRRSKSQKHRLTTYDGGTICVNGTGRGGSRVRVKDQNHKSPKLGERLKKVQLVICTCLPANCLQWAAFVQWPMQLEWRLLSKSSCRAPDKRIKNYDIF